MDKVLISEISRVKKLMGINLINEAVLTDILEPALKWAAKQTAKAVTFAPEVEAIITKLKTPGIAEDEAKIAINRLTELEPSFAKVIGPKIVDSLSPDVMQNLTKISNKLSSKLKAGKADLTKANELIDKEIDALQNFDNPAARRELKKRLTKTFKQDAQEGSGLTKGGKPTGGVVTGTETIPSEEALTRIRTMLFSDKKYQSLFSKYSKEINEIFNNAKIQTDKLKSSKLTFEELSNNVKLQFDDLSKRYPELFEDKTKFQQLIEKYKNAFKGIDKPVFDEYGKKIGSERDLMATFKKRSKASFGLTMNVILIGSVLVYLKECVRYNEEHPGASLPETLAHSLWEKGVSGLKFFLEDAFKSVTGSGEESKSKKSSEQTETKNSAIEWLKKNNYSDKQIIDLELKYISPTEIQYNGGTLKRVTVNDEWVDY